MKKRIWLFAFLLPLLVAAENFLPLSGNWRIENGSASEQSDRADIGNQPLWVLTGGKAADCAVSTVVTTRDGVGDVYLALRWQNAKNFYALRYSDPHNKLEILKISDGRESILASVEGAGENPQKKPLRLRFVAEGDRLTATAGDKSITAFADSAEAGCAALGARYRQVTFSKVDFLTLSGGVAPVAVLPVGGKRLFLRDRQPSELVFQVSGNSPATVTAQLPGFPAQKFELTADKREFHFALPEQKLKSGDYFIRYQLSEKSVVTGSGELGFSVVSARNPERFEILLWDLIDDFGTLKKIGFTAAGTPFFCSSRYTANPSHLNFVGGALDRASEGLRYGVDAILKLDTRRYWDKKRYADWMFRNKEGKLQLEGELCQNHPEYRAAVDRSLHAIGKRVQENEAIRYVLHDSETENEERKLFQCYHADCLARAAKAGFSERPAGIDRVWGMVGASLYGKPFANGAGKDFLVADDNRALAYLKWWWLDGSGFVEQRARQSEIIKQYLPQAKNFHDPILRNPAWKGRGRGMDFVSQWTYTNPSPLSVLENIDEMAAAAGETPIVPDIQLFWYTNEVAGTLQNDADRKKLKAEGEAFAEARDAVHFGRFLTISPDHLTESVWLAMARPIEALMLDGGSCISDTPGTYAYTNEHTPAALQKVLHELVIPYGPMLRTMNHTPRSVAILQSVTSSLFGRTGNYGNANGFFADVYNSVILAGLQPTILFTEELDKLPSFEALIVPEGKFFTRSEAESIGKFAASGKPVIVSQAVVPAIEKAVKIELESTAKLTPVEQEKRWNANAAKIRETLLAHGFRYMVSSDAANLVVSRRSGLGQQALFLVNDLRRAGSYVGQFGKVLEDLVPREVEVKFDPSLFDGGRVLYDALARREVTPVDGRAKFFLDGGRLLIFTTGRINAVTARAEVRDKKLVIEAQYRSSAPLKGVQPLEVEIVDPAGEKSEYSGYYLAKDGVFRVDLPIAANDRAGAWRVTVRDLLGGFAGECSFTL